MRNPKTDLAERIRGLLYDGLIVSDLRQAVADALEKHDAAQPTEQTHVRARAAYLLDPEGRFTIFGWDGGSDEDMRATTFDCIETSAPESALTVGYVNAWLPRPPKPPEIEGAVDG